MRAHSTPQQALCCACGQVRTYRQARNTIGNYFEDLLEWHRELGDLKCSHCNKVTRHALLRPDNEHRDNAEKFQRIALG